MKTCMIKMLLKRFGTILLGLILTSCIGTDKNSTDQQRIRKFGQYQMFIHAARSDTSTAVITLERTGCFGPCPVYFLALFEDGKIVYNGHKNVKIKGILYRQIPADTVHQLVNDFLQAGYLSLESEYSTKRDTLENGRIVEWTTTDMPSAVSSIKVTGKVKIVRNYFGAPEWLERLENRVDQVANSKEWVSNTN